MGRGTLKEDPEMGAVSTDPGLRWVLNSYVVNIFQVSPSGMAGGIRKD